MGACYGEPGEPAPPRWLISAAIGAVATVLREFDCVMATLPQSSVIEADFLKDLKVRLFSCTRRLRTLSREALATSDTSSLPAPCCRSMAAAHLETARAKRERPRSTATRTAAMLPRYCNNGFRTQRNRGAFRVLEPSAHT